jgi:pimeloyl-ACP methyl ester carboxylesterase
MTSAQSEQLLFLPGASGNLQFWRPVSDRLHQPAARSFIGWPGFGGVPAEPDVTGIDSLVSRVLQQLTVPSDLLAQSMGGVIALRAALARPELVCHLVLTATSGGLDLAALGGSDWRAGFRANNPELPSWFEAERSDLSAQLHSLAMPVLLLWGDADPISPVAVGERLAELLPHAELVVIAGGTHDLVFECASEVASQIARHLAT